MNKEIDLRDISLGMGYVDERGLLLRLDATNLAGFLALHDIGTMIRRPVRAEGSAYEGGVYLWLEIPMRAGEPKSVTFGNKEPRS